MKRIFHFNCQQQQQQQQSFIFTSSCSLASLSTTTTAFRHASSNNNRNRIQKRNDQLSKIFKSKQKYSQERTRALSAESEARRNPVTSSSSSLSSQPNLLLFGDQQQLQRKPRSKPVSLLEFDDNQDELFSGDQQQQDSLLVSSSTSSELQEQQQTRKQQRESEMSLLIDDDFAYLPQLDSEPKAVPGESLVLPGLTRMRFDIQFRGDHFFGWNRHVELVKRFQNNNNNDTENSTTTATTSTNGLLARSAKNAVEEALLVALDLSEFPTKEGVVASCLLETGAHARRLTCHVDIPSDILMQPRTVLQRAHVWLNKCNDPLAILSFTPASRGFHARFSVRRRVFCYKILNRIAPPLFELGTQWHVDRFLDVERMNEACRFLSCVPEEQQHEQEEEQQNDLEGILMNSNNNNNNNSQNQNRGRRRRTKGGRGFDYTAFADPKIIPTLRKFPGSGVRDLEKLHVTRQADEVFIWFVGRSFLRHQIRSMTSVLKLVGQGLWNDEILEQFLKLHSPDSSSSVLAANQGKSLLRSDPAVGWKHLQPTIAPTTGLWLWDCQYDDDVDLSFEKSREEEEEEEEKNNQPPQELQRKREILTSGAPEN